MAAFAPVTDADLARARKDAAFRQRLLEQNLETLLARVKKLRNSAPPAQSAAARQMREAIELAVRLAEMIQGAARPKTSRS
jgi:hypothetical protein